MITTQSLYKVSNSTELKDRPIIVIGSGPVGIRFIETVFKLNPEQKVILYGGEAWRPYNRVKLSSFLSGEISEPDIMDIGELIASPNLTTRFNLPITAIDRDAKQVTDVSGQVQKYSKLILATGSKPIMPSIPGNHLEGVFTFRDMNDAMQLIARRTRSRHTLVIGGGLLGLEAARAMHRLNTNVTIIEHSRRLMFHQLDDGAARLLQNIIESMGIQVITDNSVTEIQGDRHVESVRLRDEMELPVDTIIIATGIRANTELALQSHLPVGNGIRVNDYLQTSDPDIYAIGECAEHRDKVYGIVYPGYEQASVAAHNINNIEQQYTASLAPINLKLMKQPVFSMGAVEEREVSLKEIVFNDSKNNCYRKIILKQVKGKGYLLTGIIAIGDLKERARIEETIRKEGRIFPWQLLRFSTTGNIWNESNKISVASWPAESIICNCASINRGVISTAIKTNCRTIEAVCATTGAGNICGSCRPLIADLLGSTTALPAENGYRLLTASGIITLLMVFVAWFMPAIPLSTSVESFSIFDSLLTDNLLKQITGFSILGLSVLISLVSLRKRIKRITLGTFSTWRWLHATIGASLIAVLLVHTGFHLGSELNMILMLTFCALLLVGAVASISIGMTHKLGRSSGTRIREWSTWLHIILFWPLPVLLSFHILKSYWY